MFGTVNPTRRRKIRCPKCTALLTEPASPIFECPICSTFLTAKASPGDSTGKSTENHLNGNDRLPETNLEGRHKLEKIEPRQQERDSVETDNTFTRIESEPIGRDSSSIERTRTKVVSEPTPALEYSDNDQTLYRERYHQPVQTETSMSEIDAFSSAKPFHNPPQVRLTSSPDRSAESLDFSEDGRYVSGSDSASRDGSETDFDFPAPLPEVIHGEELPEILPPILQPAGFHLKENQNKDLVPAMPNLIEGEIDNGPITGHWSGLFSQDEDVKREAADKIRKAGLECVTVNCCEAEGRMKGECFDNVGESLSSQHPSEGFNKAQNSNRESAMVETENKGTEQDETTLEASERTKQQSQNANGEGSVSVDGVRGLFSAFSHQAAVEADLRYVDVWTNRSVWTEGFKDLDVSLGDWQRSKVSEPPEDLKEDSADADPLDETKVSNSAMAVLAMPPSTSSKDLSFSTLQEGDTNLKQSGLIEDEMLVNQDQVLFEMKKPDSSNAILVSGDGGVMGKSTIPIRTADMQKCLQRTEGQQNHIHDKNLKSENIYEGPDVEFKKPIDPTSTLHMFNRLNTGTLVSDNQTIVSNAFLPSASQIQDSLLHCTEKALRARHPHDCDEVNLEQSQDSDGAFLLDSALAEQSSVSNIGASSVSVPGQWSRTCHQLDIRIEGLETKDNEGKVPDIAMYEKPKTGDRVPLYMSESNSNVKGLFVKQGRLVNSNRFEQPSSGHADWLGRDTLLQSPKFLPDRDVIKQGPDCLSHSTANEFCAYGTGRDQESIHHFYPNEPYLSNSPGFVQSRASSTTYVQSHPLILPPPRQEHAFSHGAYHSIPPFCTFCLQQCHAQCLQVPQNMLQPNSAVCFPHLTSISHLPLYHNGWDSPQSHHMHALPCVNSSIALGQTYFSPQNTELHMKSNAQLKPWASLAKKQKHYPPFPQEGAAPYVLCQGCNQLLQVPKCALSDGVKLQKLCCGVCRKISKFSIHHQATYGTSNVSSAARTIHTPPFQSSSASIMNELDLPSFEAPNSSNGHFQDYGKSTINPSPVLVQGSLHEHYTETSGNEILGRHKLTSTAEHQQQLLMELDYARHGSKSSTAQLESSVTPDSPLTKHFGESASVGFSLQQRGSLFDSGDGVSLPQLSRAPGSPLYHPFRYDSPSSFDERINSKDRDANRIRGPSAQDVSRGPKHLAGLLKKSLRDFGKGGRKVTINNQLIPDTVVKKAEELAGPIDPGSYWYDYQAGFWGVMGGPCLGVLPPYIKELNFPLAKDCSGGSTGVLVNGRELHKKDLQVLGGRGLPTSPGRAYIIDSNGRVIDEASGEQFRSLGKLAPTVERKGQGYGMFQPSNEQS